jgi:WD40 repeat protein
LSEFRSSGSVNTFADQGTYRYENSFEKLLSEIEPYLYSIDIFGNLTQWSINNSTVENRCGKIFDSIVTIMLISSYQKNLLYVTGRNGHLITYNTAKMGLEKDFGHIHKGAIYSMVMTSKKRAQRLVTCGKDKSIKLWDVKSNPGQLLETYKSVSKSNILSMCFGANDRFLFCGCENGSILQFKLYQSGKALLKISEITGAHKEAINCIVVSKKEDFLFTSGDDCCLRQWAVVNRHNFMICKKNLYHEAKGYHKESVRNLKVCGDSLFSSGHDRSIKKWNITEKKEKYSIEGAHSDWVLSMDILPNGQVLFSSGEDKCLKIWCVDTGNLILDLGEIHENTVQGIAIN